MNAKTLLAGTSIAVALAAAVATPANAVVTEFATFSAKTTYNVYYKNPSSNGHSTSASFYTIATPGATTAGSVPVTFSFINNAGTNGAALDSTITNVNALFTMTGTTSGPAQLDTFSHTLEEYTSGTFSFVTTSAYTIAGVHYNAGANLLTGTFTQSVLSGKQSTGGLNGDNSSAYTPPDTLTFTSDFVTFIPTAALAYSMTLASIYPSPLSDAMAGTYALKTFKADAGGQFTADPAPHVNGVPEPASWAMMMVGFGLAGASIRRRARVQVAA